MIIKTAPYKTAQGDIVYLAEQKVRYCIENNITLSNSKSSEVNNQRLEIKKLLSLVPSLTTLEFR